MRNSKTGKTKKEHLGQYLCGMLHGCTPLNWYRVTENKLGENFQTVLLLICIKWYV